MTWSRTLPVIDAAPERDLAENLLPQLAPLPPSGAGQQLAQVITNKDLFSPDRSRAPEEASTPMEVTAPPPAHLKLVGVFLTADREEAFFADSSKGGKVVRVKKGETFDSSYHLTRISPSQATLSLGQAGGEIDFPLTVLSSDNAARVPHLIPASSQSQSASTQTGQEQAERVATRVLGAEASSASSSQDQALVIRQNIRQLQRRLRQIRRQTARERQAARADGREAENTEE
jgi:hypothetical protein